MQYKVRMIIVELSIEISSNGSKTSFETLLDYNKHPDNPHHNYMADYYRAAIEKRLKEYASLIDKNMSDKKIQNQFLQDKITLTF